MSMRSERRAMLWNSISVTLVAIEVETKMAISFLWFAAIQSLQRIKNLTGLAPKGRFVSAKTIECEIGEIG
jgi:hypothetical protein